MARSAKRRSKGRRVRPRSRKGASFKKLLKLIAVAAVMVALIFTVNQIRRRSYGGLGTPGDLKFNDYSASAFYTENGFRRYEDSRYTSLVGIDVSEHQGQIDWSRVKASGVDFAMIRVGYRGYVDGRIHLDTRFEENITGARRAGLLVGVYFYSQATTEKEAVEEAIFVSDRIKHKGVTFPVAFDMEWDTEDRISGMSAHERTLVTDAFCSIIEKNGHVPMIYGNPTWFAGYVEMSYLTDYDVWLAHYAGETAYPFTFTMWQYTDKGRVDGIGYDVDLDLRIVKK